MYIFHSVLSDPCSDVLCSQECQTKKLLADMFALFKARNYFDGICGDEKKFKAEH